MDHLEGASFAEVLRRLRKRARLTQQALAERMGAHRSTVSFWERGEYLPETLTTVLEIARVLHLSEADKRLLLEARFGTASILPWHNLPEPNPYFTGREALLETLHSALTAGEQVALVQAQAISGLGGIGKTQLALAYAYRYREQYHDILWALAESRETLIASYVTFAEQLRLEMRAEQEQRKVVEAVKRWLREHSGWLLILDNLEELGLVRDFVPTPRQGAVVLTTRRAETSPLARSLALDVLPDAESILFLLRRAGLLPKDAALEVATPRQRVTAHAIVEALGGLPLALDQAGAYLAETRCRLFDYLALLQREQEALLTRRGSIPSEHPESVTTTFALAFERVQQRSEAASDLLKLCAYLAPEAIPLDLLNQESAELGPVLAAVVDQPLVLDAALETLQAYSLVRRESEQGTLSLHRLVQAVQQEALPEGEQRRWAERAVRLVSATFPTPDATAWERCQQLLPHALVCIEHIARRGFAFPEGASLLQQTGRYLYERGAYEQALPLLQQALAQREQLYGSQHGEVAQSLNDLGELAVDQGHYEQALPLFRRALAIREQALGPVHPAVAQILNNLAVLFYYQGYYEQALPLCQRALTIREQALGATHPDVAESLNDLALLYVAKRQYDLALPLYQQALAIREQTLGPGHPDVSETLNDLAYVYQIQEQYTEALLLYQRALAIDEQVQGPHHPHVAIVLNNLAYTYLAQEQYTEALLLYQRALAICEHMLDPHHPDVAWNLNGLAELYSAQGQHDQALPLVQRALAIREQSLGPAHPEVALSLKTLALLYQAQGQDAQALPLARRALTIREQALGPDHPQVAESLNLLAQLYEAQGQDAEALPLYQRALTIQEQTLPDHPSTAATRERLAVLLRRMEQAEAASAPEVK